MPHSVFVRLFAGVALLTACSGSPAGKSAGSSSAAVTPPPAAAAVKTSSADGAVASSQPLPHDTISDRADAGRISGDAKSTIWVVMASDFQCPYCKSWHDAFFQSLLKDYVNTGRVRMAFINMPLSIHPNAVVAAEAAMCASVQNKFWPMHEALFAQQSKWAPLKDPSPVFASLAASTGLKMPEWKQCVEQHLTLSLIQADHDRASRSGAGSTPTFFVTGQAPLSGADANVRGAIDAALAKAGTKPAP
jgi:protein-disulfide isomerase